MKTIKIAALSIFLMFLSSWSVTAADDASEPDSWSERSFLILTSTKDYDTALKVAQAAASTLQIPLDLRGLTPFKTTDANQPDLSFSKMDCEQEGWSEPCYVPRGRYEKKDIYISIELTSGYKGLVPGYFFVTAGVTEPGNMQLKDLLAKAKAHFPDAYIKTGQVYMGCIH